VRCPCCAKASQHTQKAIGVEAAAARAHSLGISPLHQKGAQPSGIRVHVVQRESTTGDPRSGFRPGRRPFLLSYKGRNVEIGQAMASADLVQQKSWS
jgi:hypothetical protein